MVATLMSAPYTYTHMKTLKHYYIWADGHCIMRETIEEANEYLKICLSNGRDAYIENN